MEFDLTRNSQGSHVISALYLFLPRGGAGAALAVRVRALANWVRIFHTSSPDSHGSWVVAPRSACNSSEVHSATGHLLASTRSLSSIRVPLSITEASQAGGRQSWALRSVISICSTIISARRLHYLWNFSAGSVYLVTCINDSWQFSSHLCISLNPMPSAVMCRSSPKSAWSFGNTSATRLCCSDVGIVADLAHLALPTICVKLRGDCGWGEYHNQHNSLIPWLLLLQLLGVILWSVSLNNYDLCNHKVLPSRKETKNVHLNIQSNVVQVQDL